MDEEKPMARGDMRPPDDSRDKARSPLGTHPVGTAVGGATGAVAAGATIGTAAGPVGTAIGAAVGAVVGGVGGKLIADLIDPEMEAQFWRDTWNDRKYTDGDYEYEQDWAPAYRYGVDSFMQQPEREFTEMESDLSTGWNGARGESRLEWDRARFATLEAWQRARDLADRGNGNK